MEPIIEKEMVEKKSPLFFYALVFLVFLLGIAVVFILSGLLFKPQETVVVNKKQSSSYPTKYQYDAKPPSLSVTGTIEGITGPVKIFSRDKNDWEEIASRTAILQGDLLKLEDLGKANVNFPDLSQLSLSKNAGVNFVNLIPVNFLLEQTGGSVSYQNVKPVSIKIFDSLIALKEGGFQIDADSEIGRFNLSVSSGSAQLSYVDKANETRVYDLSKGDNIRYDSSTNTVVIR